MAPEKHIAEILKTIARHLRDPGKCSARSRKGTSVLKVRALALLAWLVMLGCALVPPAWGAPSVRTASTIPGRLLVQPVSGSGLTEDAFWKQFAATHGLKADDNFVATRRLTMDPLHTYARYRQTHQGVAVEEGEMILHLYRGTVAYATGGFVAPSLLPTAKPGIPPATALAAAQQRVQTQFVLPPNVAFHSPSPPQLIFVPAASPNRLVAGAPQVLAYRVLLVTSGDARGSYSDTRTDVDALTGAVLRTVSRSRHDLQPVIANGETVYNGIRPFDAQLDTLAHSYWLHTGFLATFDGSPHPSGPPFDTALNFTSPSLTFPANAANGLSAHWALDAAMVYFQGFPQGCANGTETPAYVNLDMDDLSWEPDLQVFTIGNGSTVFLGTLDQLGHETTHCAIDRGGIDLGVGEGGALEESFGDIFGTMVEQAMFGAPDWNNGGDLPVAFQHNFFRRLDNPTLSNPPQPDTYLTSPFWLPPTPADSTNDYGHIHVNDGVQNKWFYLLAQGGNGVNASNVSYSVQGVGLGTAAAIAYRNLFGQVMSSSGYLAAGAGAILAAGELCGDFSQERVSTQAAAAAVNIANPFTTPPVTNPLPGEMNVDPWPVTLQWEAFQTNPETSWEVQFSTSPTFDPVAIDLTATDTTTVNSVLLGTLNVNLKPSTHYYWRIRPRPIVPSPPCPCWRPAHDFTTSDRTPQVISPAKGESYPWDLKFEWTEVPHATGYEVEVATSADFSADSLIFPDPIVVETSKVLSVKVDATLHWRVRARAKDSSGTVTDGPWSAPAKFTTSIPDVQLIAPLGTNEAPWPVKFSWHRAKGADHYLLEASADKEGYNPSSPNYRKKKVDQPTDGPVTADLNFPADKQIPNFLEFVHYRVTPVGPDPLDEDGTPAISAFNVDERATWVLVPNGPAECESINTALTFTFPSTRGAQGYLLEMIDLIWMETPNLTAPYGNNYTSQTLDAQPASHQSFTFHDKTAPPKSNKASGYWYQFTAIGPEGFKGLKAGWKNYFLKSEPPNPVNPIFGSVWNNDEGMAIPMKWQTDFAQGGSYALHVWEGPDDGNVHCENGPPVLSLVYANENHGTHGQTISLPGEQPGYNYSWSVDVYDYCGCYPGGTGPVLPCGMFHVDQGPQPPPPPAPAAPVTFGTRFGGLVGSIPVIFKESPGANHYEVELHQGVIDLATGQQTGQIGPIITNCPQLCNFNQADIDSGTNTLLQMGVALPTGWHAILIGDSPLHAYVWNIRACHNNNCSALSAWNYFQEGLTWPWQ